MSGQIGKKRNSIRNTKRKRINKRKEEVPYSFKSVLCVIILLSGIVVRFAFYGTDLQKKLSDAIHGNVNYTRVVAALGKAVTNSGDIISVFKENTQEEAKSVSGEIVENEVKESEVKEDFYGMETDDAFQVYKKAEVTDIDNIEKLSFEMSEAELYDDTKAETFVIPPPSYCSNEKINIAFKYSAPIYGKVTSPYGYRDHPVDGDGGFHTGIDIAAQKGSPVKAFATGKVLEASSNNVYGNYVLIEHADNIRSFYGHNSKLCVKKGDSVKLGQKIAEVGSTGLSTGPHVHFEIRKGTLRLNPKHYISPEQI